jgi:hypothetical protein
VAKVVERERNGIVEGALSLALSLEFLKGYNLNNNDAIALVSHTNKDPTITTERERAV